MLLPVTLYGDPILKKRAEDIAADYPNLQDVIKNMWQTMYVASGVGLAAPQVGLSIRLFVVDTAQLAEKRKKEFKGIKKVFINPTILNEEGEEWKYEEGCLSIPDQRADVIRPAKIVIEYQDIDLKSQSIEADDLLARVMQHEYDHLQGVLFTDLVDEETKKKLKKPLNRIKNRKVEVAYPISSSADYQIL